MTLRGRPGPIYFTSHSHLKAPRDLPAHRCINSRHGSSGVNHWEFDKGRKSLSVAVTGPLTVDDVEILIRAVLDGRRLRRTRRGRRSASILARGNTRATQPARWTGAASQVVAKRLGIERNRLSERLAQDRAAGSFR